MKNTSIFLVAISALIMTACGGSENKTAGDNTTGSKPESMVGKSPESYDPKRGEGKFSAENLKIDAAIDQKMVAAGSSIQEVKCASCHKVTEEKLVGPGWKGVTTRRAPEWIMNFISNPDPMIDKDPEVQAQLELCLVRMPNQGLTDDEARSVLEFMRNNDK